MKNLRCEVRKTALRRTRHRAEKGKEDEGPKKQARQTKRGPDVWKGDIFIRLWLLQGAEQTHLFTEKIRAASDVKHKNYKTDAFIRIKIYYKYSLEGEVYLVTGGMTKSSPPMRSNSRTVPVLSE